jgi:tripartite-type tricarboxylate transporter receptor subunit TctC
MMKNLKVMTLILSVLAAAFTNSVMGQDFPTKPIRLIVPYAPGGAHDLLARGVQVPMGKALGTTVIVEDISGGSTKVGSMEVLKAKPDGYTLLFMGDVAWIGYYYSKTYDFKQWERATPIGCTVLAPYAFIQIRADAPYKTWAELVEYAKKNPGKLTCSGPGAGGMMELIFTQITQQAGMKCRFVPFAGASPAQTALLGGHVDFQLCNVSEAIAMIRAGKTRGIAITTDKRYELLPNVPSFKELNLGEGIWMQFAIWGPANMPRNIADKLAKAIEIAVKDPDFVTLVKDNLVNTPEFRPGPVVKEEVEKFDKTWGPKLAEAYK